MSLRGLCFDKHLNIFCEYGENEHLENNITKALLNVFDSLNKGEQKAILRNLFSIELGADDFRVDTFLQKSPNDKESLVASIPVSRRFLLAFSPTGKTWGELERLDIKDEKAVKDSLEKHVKEEHEDWDGQYVKEAVQEQWEDIKSAHDGGSIPDGWLVIYQGSKPYAVVILENKKYDLDPYQLNNHLEKSLLLTSADEKDGHIIYETYKDVIDVIKQSAQGYLVDQFVEYMTLLGYVEVPFSVACSATESYVQSLVVSQYAMKIMKGVNDSGAGYRGWNFLTSSVHYPYLNEINLYFGKDELSLSLAFGPKMSQARNMLDTLDIGKIRALQDKYPGKLHHSMHLLYQRGRNIKESYFDKDPSCPRWDLADYICYMQSHSSYLRLLTPEEAIEFENTLYEDGKISESFRYSIVNYLRDKKNMILVVPEIGFDPCWTYKYAAEIGIDRLIQEIKSTVEEALESFGLK